jgi:hypothetical protein
MADTPTADDMMAAYAQDAVDFAKAQFQIDLDFSEASVEKVEAILGQLHGTLPKGFMGKLFGKKPSLEQIRQMGMVLGGYVGEVMRREWGGRWKMESDAFPGQKVATLQIGGTDLWPHFKAGKRIQNGPEDNVWHYFQLIKEENRKSVYEPAGDAT